MNTWSSITESELLDLIENAWHMMSVAQKRLWDAIKITPVKWQEPTYGIDGGGFWVVAIYGSTVIWYNDIEDGFNSSRWKAPGTIDEYGCNQSELQCTIHHLLDQWRDDFLAEINQAR